VAPAGWLQLQFCCWNETRDKNYFAQRWLGHLSLRTASHLLPVSASHSSGDRPNWWQRVSRDEWRNIFVRLLTQSLIHYFDQRRNPESILWLEEKWKLRHHFYVLIWLSLVCVGCISKTYLISCISYCFVRWFHHANNINIHKFNAGNAKRQILLGCSIILCQWT